MKDAMLVCIPILLAIAPPGFARDSENWPVREQQTIQKTLSLTEAPQRLVIDNIDGYVHVTGVEGSQVRVTAHKTVRADSEKDLQESKEVSLDMTEKPGSVSVYYNAPWRCDSGTRHCDHQERRFYTVTYDIDIEAPRNARLVVSAVNHGDIRVDNAAGQFEVSDINGGISMTGIAGSGEVHTINGPVSVRFARNPASKTSFKSLNGQMDIYFQPHFSADLLFKTFNGQIYSDFEVASRPAPAAAAEQSDGKFVYHSKGVAAGRAGNGGPELSFDAFNGNIRLHEAK